MNCDTCGYRVALPGFGDKAGQPQTPHHHPDDSAGHAQPRADRLGLGHGTDGPAVSRLSRLITQRNEPWKPRCVLCAKSPDTSCHP